jgi:subtilisin family serine protease
MATPHVAGVAALVYAHGVKDPDQIKRLLTSTAQDLGSRGWDSTYGFGLVDPVAALNGRVPPRLAREGKGGKGEGGKAGKGAKGGGPGGGGDELEITGVRVRKAGETRAVINWLTTEPARTSVRGDNDFQRKDDNLTKVHSVVVQGRAGQTVTYTIASSKGQDDRATETVKVTF